MRCVTVDDVMSWEPCGPYTRERVTSLFAGRARVTALDVCAMDIPRRDILWAVLREDMIEGRVLHLFACWCAEQALIAEREAGREPDPASWVAVEVKRRWLDGAASDDELKVARANAWFAAGSDARATWATARGAARAAAWATARAVARETSWTAARAAAWSAARAARGAAGAAAWAALVDAEDSAWATVRDRQLRHLVEMLKR